MSSILDLTGRASEDEPVRQSARSRRKDNMSINRRPPRNNCTALALNPIQSTLTQYLPCPLDLYNTFTPLSLIQLPFVSIIYILLQLPLHYNSTTATADTILHLSENEWQERVKSVEKLTSDMQRNEKEMGEQRREHKMMRREVGDLKRRLGRLREKREEREKWVMDHGMPGDTRGGSVNAKEGKKDG